MAWDKSFYIHTHRDGELGDTTREDVEMLVGKLRQQQKVVIHFHGGLVTKANAIESAKKLKDAYQDAGAYPIFFIWESDIQTIISNNLHEINKEHLFRRLLIQLTKFTLGKLLDTEGGKATGQLTLPTDIEVAIEINKAKDEISLEEPYENVTAQINLKPLNEQELQFFESQLQNDPSIEEALNEIVTSDTSDKTLMSEEIVEQLEEEATADGKGIVTTAFFLNKLRTILTRIITRFIDGRDHGVYPTVIEEILRELYADKIGEYIWSAIKKETADTFEYVPQQPGRGGWLFLDLLSGILTSDQPPEIILVGHSAGAVFICNLLRHFHMLRSKSNLPSLKKFRFKTVLFLAPACDFELFNDVITNYGDTFTNFRMFTMNDTLEAKDAIVPGIYTRSLLYFISGLLEKDIQNPGKSAFDHPIVGMQRYYNNPKVYNSPAVEKVRAFVLNPSKRVVWSLSTDGPGLIASAKSHGGFAEEPDTLSSIQHIIREE
jgi:hypothetical protein